MKRRSLVIAPLALIAPVTGVWANTIIKYAFRGTPYAIGLERYITDKFVALNPSIGVGPVVSACADCNTKPPTTITGGAAPEMMHVDFACFNDFMKVRYHEGLSRAIVVETESLEARIRRFIVLPRVAEVNDGSGFPPEIVYLLRLGFAGTQDTPGSEGWLFNMCDRICRAFGYPGGLGLVDVERGIGIMFTVPRAEARPSKEV